MSPFVYRFILKLPSSLTQGQQCWWLSCGGDRGQQPWYLCQTSSVTSFWGMSLPFSLGDLSSEFLKFLKLTCIFWIISTISVYCLQMRILTSKIFNILTWFYYILFTFILPKSYPPVYKEWPQLYKDKNE